MISVALVVQGSSYLSNADGSHKWILAVAAIICAAFLLLGLFTPIASLLVTVGVAGTAFSWFVAPKSNLFAENLMALDIAITSLSVLLLGPGAYSLDARLFGRREIIIPHPSNSTHP
jgi:uncharacterized membrane protein YphA (DoxX/SURF4 family)